MIIIQRISSAVASEIIADSELSRRVCDDLTNFDRIELPESDFYFGFFLEGECIGFVHLSPETAVTYVIHINIVVGFRHLALDCAKMFYNFALNTFAPSFQKLISKIPVTFPDVYGFAKKCGFQDEGLDRKSILREGVLIDRYALGITREEIKKWVEL